MRLYSELADWWPLLSPPSHYVDEAAELANLIRGSNPTARTLLELGSGGGSMAFHLQRHFALTLTDRSPQMLAVSQAINSECEHLVGDMQTLDLQRLFDAVLIHDAIAYATSRSALVATLRTAHRHCRPGGAVVVMPDFLKETFQSANTCGGEDGSNGRALRYLEWMWDPNTDDESCEVAYAFLLRHADGTISVELDRHQLGVFPLAAWFSAFRDAGFMPPTPRPSFGRTIFVVTKQSQASAGQIPNET